MKENKTEHCPRRELFNANPQSMVVGRVTMARQKPSPDQCVRAIS